MSRREQRARTYALLVGALATAAVCIAYALGWLERAEKFTLDLRFRYANSIREHTDIVCIDIDDRALELSGRKWPWPRDYQAALISVPAELGARAILVDITYVEPEPYRTDWSSGANVTDGSPDELARSAFPDDELEAAIRAGNVYLAYHYPRVDLERSDAFGELVDALERDAAAQAARLADAIGAHYRQLRERGLELPAREYAYPLERARMVVALQEEPTLGQDALAERLGLGEAFSDALLTHTFSRARETALRRITRRWLEQDPLRWQASPADVFAELFVAVSDEPFENESGFKRALQRAFFETLSYRATTAHPLLPPERSEAVSYRVDGITPVFFRLARAARRCGFVNFKEDLDGVIRRKQLLAVHRGNVLSQLAFALGVDLLNVAPEDIVLEPSRLTLQRGDGGGSRLEIQLDAEGRMMVPWVPGRDWSQQFGRHLNAIVLWNVGEYRRRIAHNQRVIDAERNEALSDPYFPQHVQHSREIEELAQLRLRQADARVVGDLAGHQRLQHQIDALDARIQRRWAQAVERIEADYARLSQDPSQAASDQQLNTVYQLRGLLAALEEFEQANRELRAEVRETLDALRPMITGKVCLIGYTATSLADMKPIPTHPSAPGVMAHANIVNGLLTGRMVSWMPAWGNVLLAGLLGLVGSVISVWRTPREAAGLAAALAVTFVTLAGWVAFYGYTYWIALTPTVGALLLSYVSIAVYRYVFIEGERRQLTTALGQFTTKELARQFAENPELCQRAEMREVTTMFTDLKDFTGISERIGAERTQLVLNTCLGCFTDVMLRHGAMVNKFMGDGVFAFWNPVIYPQSDHALRACETAVDLLAELDQLRTAQRAAGGDSAFEDLVLRVGVASGNAIVGPCGSEQKYDYTCIGDSVNLAARLESANKFYGTMLLVSALTREQVGGAFVFRPLGGVQVKGKRHAVPIFELLGRAGQVPEELRTYAERFGAAVGLFQKREWGAALEAFALCVEQRPEDLAAQRYHEATARLLAEPPSEAWSGAIELVEK